MRCHCCLCAGARNCVRASGNSRVPECANVCVCLSVHVCLLFFTRALLLRNLRTVLRVVVCSHWIPDSKIYVSSRGQITSTWQALHAIRFHVNIFHGRSIEIGFAVYIFTSVIVVTSVGTVSVRPHDVHSSSVAVGIIVLFGDMLLYGVTQLTFAGPPWS